jgi:hypothetical protein
MGTHIDTRTQHRQKTYEHDELTRRKRATFKQYLRHIEEDLLVDEEDSRYTDIDIDMDIIETDETNNL